MDIGHIGAGLALKKVDNKINLGGLIFASELWILFLFYLCYWELRPFPQVKAGSTYFQHCPTRTVFWQVSSGQHLRSYSFSQCGEDMAGILP